MYGSCRIFARFSPIAGDCRGVVGGEKAREKILGFQNGGWHSLKSEKQTVLRAENPLLDTNFISIYMIQV